MITNQDIVNTWNSLPEDERKKIITKFNVSPEMAMEHSGLKKFVQLNYILEKRVITK